VIALAMVLGAAEHGVRDVHTWQNAEGQYWSSTSVTVTAGGGFLIIGTGNKPQVG
jgi:hypothetical protein